MKFISLAAAAVLTAAIAAPAAATPVSVPVIANPSFETGDLTGWSPDGGATGSVAVVTQASDFFQFNTFFPTDGSFFAQLNSGDVGVYTTLSQGFTLDRTQTILADVNFLAFDFLPEEGGANDDGYLRVINQTTQASTYLFRSNVNAVNDFGSTGWETVGVRLDQGVYSLEAGVENAAGNDDPLFSSQLLVDNVQVGVPEPAAWGLMILGFAGVGGALRRRHSAAAAV